MPALFSFSARTSQSLLQHQSTAQHSTVHVCRRLNLALQCDTRTLQAVAGLYAMRWRCAAANKAQSSLPNLRTAVLVRLACSPSQSAM